MSSGVNICGIPDTVRAALQKFRIQNVNATTGLILKVDRKTQQIVIDKNLDRIETIDDLQEDLNGHQPRYIILSYRQEHRDGRISYPLCLIYFTPRDSHAELQMMYAGTKKAIQNVANVHRAFEIRELEDLTEEWLVQKLERV